MEHDKDRAKFVRCCQVKNKTHVVKEKIYKKKTQTNKTSNQRKNKDFRMNCCVKLTHSLSRNQQNIYAPFLDSPPPHSPSVKNVGKKPHDF
jgi:hypothetical protein